MINISKEETKALPITYEEVKEYSDNLFALLDALKEVQNDVWGISFEC